MKTLDLTQNILDIDGKVAIGKYEKTVEEEVERVVERKVGEEITKETIKELKEVKKLEDKELTLGLVIRDTVLNEIENVKGVEEEEHLLRYSIFKRVTTNEQAEFNDEEISFIKKLIARRYMPIFAAQIIIMLNK